MARRPLPVRTADGWKCPVIGERRPHLKRRLASPRLPTGRGPLLIDSCLRAPLETIAAQLSIAVAVCRPNARCPTAVRRTPGGLTAIAQFRAAPARALHPRRTDPTRGSSSTEAHLHQRQRQRPPESPGPRRPPAHHGARHLRAAKRLLEANHPLEVKAAERGHRVVRANPTVAGPCVEAGDKKKSGSDSKVFRIPDNGSRIRLDRFMAIYAIRFARHAVIIALFVLAALLGIATGVIFAYAGDVPQISALDDYAPSTITRVYGSHGEVVGEFAIAAARGRSVRGHFAEAPAGDHRRGGLGVRAALRPQHAAHRHGRDARHARRDSRQDHRPPIAAQRREHDHAAARARALPRSGRLPDRRRQPRTKDQGSHRRRADREALHQERDLHALRQPDVPRRRRVRRRGRSAHLLRQVGKDLTLDEAATIAGLFQTWRNAPTVNMDRAKRRRAYVLHRMAEERLHHSQGSRRRQGAADRAGGGAGDASNSIAAVLRRGSPEGPREPVRREAAV